MSRLEPSCRDWTPRAWPARGRSRADARCDRRIASLEPNDDLEPNDWREIDNWRERALRRAAVEECDWITPSEYLARYCHQIDAASSRLVAICRSDGYGGSAL